MKAKLFVTDMDGTLLNSERKISEGNKAAIKKAVEAGVIFTIATGRMHASALPFAQELGVEVPIITYNGALIKTTAGKEIYASYLEPELIKELVAFCWDKGFHVHLYSDDKLYFREDNEKARYYQHACGVKGEIVGDRLLEYTAKVPKLLMMSDNPEEGEAMMQAVREHFGSRVETVKSAPTYMELLKPGVTKASAIAKLAEIMGVPEEQVLAIGDSGNDIPMLKAVAFGVAMGNATPEARAAAKYFVADCDHDGLAEAVERFCL